MVVILMGVTASGKTTVGLALAQRKDHYMSPALLPSQVATLELPTDALCISVEQTVPAIVQAIVTALDLGDYPESQVNFQTEIS